MSGPYSIIYADPPWSFLTYSKKHMTPHRCAVDHYAVMSFTDLQALPVPEWAAKDCALFMWIVGSHVDVGIDLAKHWGFQFKTDAFVWDKGKIGMGYWSRKQTETCYLFTRGKPRRMSKGVRQLVKAPRREHSRKPDEVAQRIIDLCGDLPRLEMFARCERVGWDVFGNQTDLFEAA